MPVELRLSSRLTLSVAIAIVLLSASSAFAGYQRNDRANVKRWIKAFFTGGLLALALFGAAAAGPLDDAEAAYLRGDYARAMRIARPLADKGNAFAVHARHDVQTRSERSQRRCAGRLVVSQGR